MTTKTHKIEGGTTTPIQETEKCKHKVLNALLINKEVTKYECAKCHKRIKRIDGMEFTKVIIDEWNTTPIQETEKCKHQFRKVGNQLFCEVCAIEYDRVKHCYVDHWKDTTPVQETWQEDMLKLFYEDINHHLHLIDGSNTLEHFIESLLQRKERETIKRVMGVRPKTELLGQVRGLEDAETMFANTRLIGFNQALQEWTDNINKLTIKEE